MEVKAHPSLAITRGKSRGLSKYITPNTEGFSLASSAPRRSSRPSMAGSEYGIPIALKHNAWLLIVAGSVCSGTILRRSVNTDEDMFAPYAKYQTFSKPSVTNAIVSNYQVKYACYFVFMVDHGPIDCLYRQNRGSDRSSDRLFCGVLPNDV